RWTTCAAGWHPRRPRSKASSPGTTTATRPDRDAPREATETQRSQRSLRTPSGSVRLCASVGSVSLWRRGRPGLGSPSAGDVRAEAVGGEAAGVVPPRQPAEVLLDRRERA